MDYILAARQAAGTLPAKSFVITTHRLDQADPPDRRRITASRCLNA